MAIFKRGKKRDFGLRVKEAVWPSQGWRRTFHYYRHRIFRTGDSTYKITAGLAAGAAVSWSPFLGTHFAQAIFLSWLIRGNLLAGFIGTALGNPSTFPFMFWLSYKLGTFILGLAGFETEFAGGMDAAYLQGDSWAFLKYLFAHPLQLLLPLVIGGYLCAFLCWPVAYAVLYYPVRAARRAYRLQRLRLRRKKNRKNVR
ncbi:MAG: DUF2062 domain-containing protein [Rhodospirillales bacterium]|nr:DUF2062 domain-containing protein [Rhodospirillales bacterium]MCB9997296.1 DUF2062 domain-containing protein [Rhodospirillales bacterium]